MNNLLGPMVEPPPYGFQKLQRRLVTQSPQKYPLRVACYAFSLAMGVVFISFSPFSPKTPDLPSLLESSNDLVWYQYSIEERSGKKYAS